MKWFLLLVALVVPTMVFADGPPEVDVAEVIRRGDCVTVTGEGPRGAAEIAFGAAMSPPADDNHMWHITVWKSATCTYCGLLESDFRQAPELLAFVAAREPAKPWAHLNWYAKEDDTQKWRREKYRVTAYPTIVVQPPRNGMWGDPGTVVMYEVGYDGDEKRLAGLITGAVRKYAAKMAEKGYPRQPVQTIEPASETSPAESEAAPALELPGQSSSSAFDRGFAVAQVTPAVYRPDQPMMGAGQMPFNTPPPATDPFSPTPYAPQYPMQIPPAPQPQQQNPAPTAGGLLAELIGFFLGGQSLGNTMLIVLVALRAYESLIAPRTKTTIDDNAVRIVRELLTKQQTPANQQPSPPSSNG